MKFGTVQQSVVMNLACEVYIFLSLLPKLKSILNYQLFHSYDVITYCSDC